MGFLHFKGVVRAVGWDVGLYLEQGVMGAPVPARQITL
jgi:hypothetical protein